MGNRKMKNILDLKMNKILSGALIKPTKILNPSSPRSPSFLNFALLDFPDKTPAKPFNSQ
jgi:hypothetical protein